VAIRGVVRESDRRIVFMMGKILSSAPVSVNAPVGRGRMPIPARALGRTVTESRSGGEHREMLHGAVRLL
ncbi:MAG: hypothetical protein MI919_32420, partial [Holophagales bacterium]|nr:hypothetical protein [Holophagales bacterium]